MTERPTPDPSAEPTAARGRPWWPVALAVVAAIAGLLAAGRWWLPPAPPKASHIERSQLSWRTLAGPPLRADQHQGPLLLHYWASWCPPCVEELPRLDAIAGSLRNQHGVEILTVAVDRDTDLQRFLAAHPVSLPVGIEGPDDPDTTSQLGNPRGLLPFTLAIGADDAIRARHTGPLDNDAIRQLAKAAAR